MNLSGSTWQWVSYGLGLIAFVVLAAILFWVIRRMLARGVSLSGDRSQLRTPPPPSFAGGRAPRGARDTRPGAVWAGGRGGHGSPPPGGAPARARRRDPCRAGAPADAGAATRQCRPTPADRLGTGGHAIALFPQ